MTGSKVRRASQFKSLVLIAGISSASAFAQFNNDIDWGQDPNWAVKYGYIGSPQFSLRDDYELASARDAAREQRRRVRRIERDLQPIERNLDQKQKQARKLRQEIETLSTSIAKKEKQIEKLRGEIQQANSQLPQLKTRLQQATQKLAQLEQQQTDKSAELRQATQASAAASQNLQAARVELRNFIRSCVAGGATAQECQQKPQAQKLKGKVTRLDQKVKNLAQKQRKLRQQIQGLNGKIKTAKTNKQQISTRLKRAQDLVNNGQTRLATLRQNLQSEKQKSKQVQQKLAQAKQAIDRLQNDAAPLRQRLSRAQNRLQDLIREAKAIRRNLIDRVIYANREGHRNGSHDGQQEGVSLAQQLGYQYGSTDGQEDGDQQGTSAGQNREYQAGYGEGAVIGDEKGSSDGERDGRALGRREGNSVAGDRAGTADGIVRAERSDAAIVGQQQGTEDGMQRAIIDGNRTGTPQGQNRAIQREESKNLKNAVIDGAFAGTFSHGVPAYPGITQPSFRSCDQYFKQIVRMACRDGLNIGYYSAGEQAYHAQVGNSYQQAYNASHSNAYQQALNQYYQASFNQGKSDGENETYAKVYPVVKEEFRQSTKQAYILNPETNSSEYQGSFALATANTYASKYEEIRSDKFALHTKRTYDANIAEQTEKYAAIRDQQVTNVYNSSAVISYVSSSVRDGGVQGVAANDSIFQPKENIVYDIVIKNFGQRSTGSVTAKLRNGKQVKLPAIPAGSIVTVKAAALDQVLANNAEKDRTELVLVANVNTTDKSISLRHFYNASIGQLNPVDSKTLAIQYPIQVSSLGATTDLLFNEAANVVGKLVNKSSRQFIGPIQVELNTSKGKAVITKPMNSLASISQSETISGAEVLIDDESDALETLSFSVDVLKNGVKIGEVRNSGTQLVRIPYLAKEKAPVLIGNAQGSATSLLDIIADLNGIENVSVLDMSMSQPVVNKENELKDKTIVIAKNIDGEVLSTVNALATKQDGLVIGMLNKGHTEIMKLKNAQALQLSPTFTLNIAGVENKQVTTSNTLAKDVNPAVLLTGDSVESIEEVASIFKTTIAQDFENASSFLSQEDIETILSEKKIDTEVKSSVQITMLKIVTDILKTHEVYKDSSDKGKRLLKKLEKDSNDTLNQVIKLAEKALADEDVNGVLTGIIILDEIQYAFDKHDKLRKVNSRIKRSIEGRFVRKVLRKMKSKLRRLTSRSFERKFMRGGDLNVLVNNFSPIKE